MSNQHPQSSTYKLLINNQQLQDLILGLESLKEPAAQFDTDDLMYVSPANMIGMLKDLAKGEDKPSTLHGLCL